MLEQPTSLRPSEERLRLVEDKLGVGSWTWDRRTEDMTWSPGLYKLLGLDPALIRPSLPFFENLVHPQDRFAFGQLEGLATDTRQRSRRFRIIRPDGGLKWLWSRAQTVFDRSGGIERVVSAVADVSELEELRLEFDSNIELMRTVARLLEIEFWIADASGQMLETPAIRSGYNRMEPGQANLGWRDSVHADDREDLAATWQHSVAKGHKHVFSPRVRLADGQYRTVHVMGLPFEHGGPGEALWGGVVTLNSRVLSLTSPDKPFTELLGAPHVRAARAYLGWSADDLASRAKVSVSTIRRIESASCRGTQAESLKLIQTAFETAGLAFWRDHEGRFCLAGT